MAVGRLRGHALYEVVGHCIAQCSLSDYSQYASLKGESLENILKRFTEESSCLCVNLKGKNTILQ